MPRIVFGRVGRIHGDDTYNSGRPKLPANYRRNALRRDVTDGLMAGFAGHPLLKGMKRNPVLSCGIIVTGA